MCMCQVHLEGNKREYKDTYCLCNGLILITTVFMTGVLDLVLVIGFWLKCLLVLVTFQ